MINHHWIAGSPRAALAGPFTAVLTESRLAMLLLTLATLGLQTFRAASANPVDSLRSE